MKAIALLLLSLNISVTFGQIHQESIPESYGFVVALGQTIPDIRLETLDGKHINIKDLRGKIIMLQFTASWCSVCRREMPEIEKEIWLKHKNKNNFALFGIDLKEDAETVAKFQTDTKVSYPITLDHDGSIFYTIANKDAGITRNIIIDSNGKIVFMTRLFNEKEFQKMAKTIELLLNMNKRK